MGSHINAEGLFQSDKYPTCPAGKVPLSVKDATAQDLLWTYAQRRRAVDAEFADDLETALKAAGYKPPVPYVDVRCDVCRLLVSGPGADVAGDRRDSASLCWGHEVYDDDAPKVEP